MLYSAPLLYRLLLMLLCHPHIIIIIIFFSHFILQRQARKLSSNSVKCASGASESPPHANKGKRSHNSDIRVYVYKQLCWCVCVFSYKCAQAVNRTCSQQVRMRTKPPTVTHLCTHTHIQPSFPKSSIYCATTNTTLLP